MCIRDSRGRAGEVTADRRRPTAAGEKQGGRGAGEQGRKNPTTRHPPLAMVGGRWSAVLLLILLLAFALRAWNLTGVPPGLTHDEANHGREAIDILDGVFRLFFPLNYGSEPIYSYTVALSMAPVSYTHLDVYKRQHHHQVVSLFVLHHISPAGKSARLVL